MRSIKTSVNLHRILELAFRNISLDKLLGVDRLSAWPIIGADIKHFTDIGHFKNRFADNFFFYMQTNILFTGDIIYW